MKNGMIKVSDVVYREDLYPRFAPDPAVIQKYAEDVGVLPPIEIDQHRILIDGYHRWKAFETAKVEDIPCIVTEVESEAELEMLAVERNSKHGKQLSSKEKAKYARKWFMLKIDPADICKRLSCSERAFLVWTEEARRQHEAEQKQQVHDMWLACEKQQDITEAVGVPRQTIERWIAAIAHTRSDAETGIFGSFSPELYAVWNFAKATNEVRHFGNIPPEIIENLLYYYTDPFDVVFDPFGGGGSTIDVCKKRHRRYYVSDLNPIPARSDIRQHDITAGLPDGMPVPDLVFLDPPYWKQAEKRYSEDATDLSNVELEEFLAQIGKIAQRIKRKWSQTKTKRRTLAIIIGPWDVGDEYVDLPGLCTERIKKYMQLVKIINVPYSTQIHPAHAVARAKEKKQILYLPRNLMVFSHE